MVVLIVRLNPVLRFETLLDQLVIAQLPIKLETSMVVDSIDFVVGQLARVTCSWPHERDAFDAREHAVSDRFDATQLVELHENQLVGRIHTQDQLRANDIVQLLDLLPIAPREPLRDRGRSSVRVFTRGKKKDAEKAKKARTCFKKIGGSVTTSRSSSGPYTMRPVSIKDATSGLCLTRQKD